MRQRFRAGGLHDQQGLVLHELHGGNTSKAFATYALPPFLLSQLFPGYTPV